MITDQFSDYLLLTNVGSVHELIGGLLFKTGLGFHIEINNLNINDYILLLKLTGCDQILFLN